MEFYIPKTNITGTFGGWNFTFPMLAICRFPLFGERVIVCDLARPPPFHSCIACSSASASDSARAFAAFASVNCDDKERKMTMIINRQHLVNLFGYLRFETIKKFLHRPLKLLTVSSTKITRDSRNKSPSVVSMKPKQFSFASAWPTTTWKPMKKWICQYWFGRRWKIVFGI